MGMPNSCDGELYKNFKAESRGNIEMQVNSHHVKFTFFFLHVLPFRDSAI